MSENKESIERAIAHLRMAIHHLEDANKRTEHDQPVLRLVKKVHRQLIAK